MIKKKIKQHKLLSQMVNEMKPKPLVNMAKLKAITVILLIILGLTFGVYYMGKLNIAHLYLPNNSSIAIVWIYGFINTVICLFVAIGIYIGLRTLYEILLREFSK